VRRTEIAAAMARLGAEQMRAAMIGDPIPCTRGPIPRVRPRTTCATRLPTLFELHIYRRDE
jgi:hypothetical protein